MTKTTRLLFLTCICGLLICAASADAQIRNNNATQTDEGPCSGINAGSIRFSSSSSSISPALESNLSTLAGQMQYSPACRVVISGSGGGSKVEQQLSWDRVNAIIEYMSEHKNIDRNRFVFVYDGNEAAPNTVIFRTTHRGEEDWPSNVAAPHPNLQRD